MMYNSTNLCLNFPFTRTIVVTIISSSIIIIIITIIIIIIPSIPYVSDPCQMPTMIVMI